MKHIKFQELAFPKGLNLDLLAEVLPEKKLMRKWREKSEGSKAIPKSIFEAYDITEKKMLPVLSSRESEARSCHNKETVISI